MIISQCICFQFGDLNSTEFDIINCRIDSGMANEPFLAPRTIKETQIRGRSPYFHEVERQNLSFSVIFAFRSGWDTKEKLREVARWLDSDYYKPLIFYDDFNLIPTGDEVIYYSILSDAPQITHNGSGEGYLTLQFKTNSAYGFSPIYLTQNTPIYEYFFSPWLPTPMPTNIRFENKGDIAIKPIITIKTFIREFSIINLSNSGQKLKFTELEPNEILEIDSEIELIMSSVPDTNRINNMSSDSDFMELVTGVNNLQCLGNFEFQIKYELQFLT